MENQNGNNWERPTIQNNFYGQQINHVDKIEAHFDKNMGIEVDGQDILKDMAQASSQDEDWIGEILLCFMGDKANALEFVRLARMLKPAQITNLVNAWLVEKISAIIVICGNRSTIMVSIHARSRAGTVRCICHGENMKQGICSL
jgi:hypothetical protein